MNIGKSAEDATKKCACSPKRSNQRGLVGRTSMSAVESLGPVFVKASVDKSAGFKAWEVA